MSGKSVTGFWNQRTQAANFELPKLSVVVVSSGLDFQLTAAPSILLALDVGSVVTLKVSQRGAFHAEEAYRRR